MPGPRRASAAACAAFPPGPKVPHMGWNQLSMAGACALLRRHPRRRPRLLRPLLLSRASELRGRPAPAPVCLVRLRRALPARHRPGTSRRPSSTPRRASAGACGCSRTSPPRRRRGGAPSRRACDGSSMIVFPADRLRGGRCVRLAQGALRRARPSTATTRGQARALGRARARAGCTSSTSTARFAGAPRQTGAGRGHDRGGAPSPCRWAAALRGEAAVEAVLAAGARWAVLGTRAVLDARVPRRAPAAAFAGPDHRGGRRARTARVAVKGWTEDSSVDALVDLGATRPATRARRPCVYTDIGRDGTERGPNVGGHGRAGARARVPVHRLGRRGPLARPARAGARVAGVCDGVDRRAARSTPARSTSRSRWRASRDASRCSPSASSPAST